MLLTKPKTKRWNCRDKDNKCLMPIVIYQADVTNDTDDTYKYNLGLEETSFKDRYNNNKS